MQSGSSRFNFGECLYNRSRSTGTESDGGTPKGQFHRPAVHSLNSFPSFSGNSHLPFVRPRYARAARTSGKERHSGYTRMLVRIVFTGEEPCPPQRPNQFITSTPASRWFKNG